jgi:nickel transport protein
VIPAVRRVLRLTALALLLQLSASFPAKAHTLRMFAYVDGATIRGSVYFGASVAARDARVTVSGPGGETLFATVSDAEGAFRVPVQSRVDHHLVADTGDGHRAEFTIAARELSPSASAGQPASAEPRVDESRVDKQAAADRQKTAAPAELTAMIESAIARQMGPLRAEIAAFEERIWLRDVLGGLGYILGLAGLAAYFLSRQRQKGRCGPASAAAPATAAASGTAAAGDGAGGPTDRPACP